METAVRAEIRHVWPGVSDVRISFVYMILLFSIY